jgi:hypothetical protein
MGPISVAIFRSEWKNGCAQRLVKDLSTLEAFEKGTAKESSLTLSSTSSKHRFRQIGI